MKTITKIISILILLGLLIALIIFTIYPTKYATPDKYKNNVFSGGSLPTMTKEKQKFAQKLRHDAKVRVTSDTTASLGDFIFNSGGKTKIVANISIKFQNSKDDWFNSDSAKNEISKRGTLLRSAIIDTMMDNHGIKTNNDRIKTQLLENINYNLSDATATEIYFNKFIVQY